VTPDRLREILALVRWSQQALARAVECDPRLAQRWATGQAPVPEPIGRWLEALGTAHEAHPAPTDWRVRQRVA
jgi:transcriptional regulator with XRE-family HTH domain